MKESYNVFNTLGTRGRVAGGAAESDQETNMASNAVADCTKARQVNEKTLLEDGGQRIIEIGSLRKPPQHFNDLGSFGCDAKEIRKNPESLPYAILKV